jgi:predicted ATPase
VFRRIEAVGYRCLREINQKLNPFEILVGANGSGKSSFLDVIHLLSDFLRDGLQTAIDRRTRTFQDLVWGRQGTTFRFTAELSVPRNRGLLYTVAIALDEQAGKVEVADESATLLFGENAHKQQPVMVRSGKRVHYYAEDGKGEFIQDRLRNQSSLQAVPRDDAFPTMAWFRDLLEEEIRTVVLDPKALAEPSLAHGAAEHLNTGAALAWQIEHLEKTHAQHFKDWTSHVRTALPDVCKIESIPQPWNDNRRFVRIHYENGVQVPSWMLSEGTLRLLALTILAYLPNIDGAYLIEEPENGVHPAALETIYQSLSSVYNAQVIVATQSPVLLSMATPEQILCFSKTPEGTTIIRGDEHPALKEWQGEVSLGTMVASGILS